jgi:hypothetical protein
MSSLHYIDNTPIHVELDTSLAKAGWKITSIGGGYLDTVHNPELDRHLADGGSLRYRITGPSFAGADQDLVKAVVDSAVAKGKSVFNSPKIRISSDPAIGSVLNLSQTDYFQGLATNEIALKTAVLPDGRSINGTDMAFPSNIIPSLSQAKLSNHLGAGALAFDAAGFVSLVRTGKASMVSAQKIAPSAAGSADATDFKDCENDLVDCVLAGLKRELIEEQGITESDIQMARIIGFQRNISRGAKPEFIGLIKISDTWKNTRKGISEEEAVFTEGHIDLDCRSLGLNGLRTWLRDNDDHLSFSVKQCFFALFAIAKTDADLQALITV